MSARALFLALVAAVLLIGAALIALRDPDAVPLPPAMTIVSAHGEVVKIDGSGPVDAAVGTPLQPGDRVATGVDGRAVIARVDETPIRLAPSTAVRIVAAEDQRLELELERGQVRARVRSDAGTVRVSNDRRAVTARQGAFAVRVDERGLFSADVEEGSVALEGFGELTEAKAGQRAVSWADGRASASSISADPLLDVDWPTRTAATQIPIAGVAEPGARVRVVKPVPTAAVEVGPDGRFELMIALVEGNNELELEVVDVEGRLRTAYGAVVRDTKGPTVHIKLDYGKR